MGAMVPVALWPSCEDRNRRRYRFEISVRPFDFCFVLLHLLPCVVSNYLLHAFMDVSTENRFCIRYVPKSREQANRECNAAAERLSCCLEQVIVSGDAMRGTKMKWEMADEMMDFYVNYDLFVYGGKEPIPVMEELSVETSMKA